MSKVAYSSGGLGDIVFQIPAMKELGVTIVQMPFAIYTPMFRLLEYVGFICAVAERYTTEDYNMDHFRKQPRRGVNHIMLSIANQFGTSKPTFESWLKVDASEKHKLQDGLQYAVVHVTQRWRENSKVKWEPVLISDKSDYLFYCGLYEEFERFFTFEGGRYAALHYIHTADILELAQVIAGANKVYCNQSVVMALCQAMGKEYYGEFKPGKTNCRTFKPNEHVLS